MFFRLFIFSFCIILFLFPAVINAEPLTVSYFERRPYYFTDENGNADGFLIAHTRRILRESGIEARFLSLTPNQILYVIKHANKPHCSVGWFKKPEREMYAQFSRPFYRNRPLVLLIRQEQRDIFEKFDDLRTLFKAEGLVMARMSSFSYGSYVDDLLEKLNPTSFFETESQLGLLQSIAEGNSDYMLIAPEEIDELIGRSHFSASRFTTKTLHEIPAGNLRYLMCNQVVDDEIMGRINHAIAEIDLSTQ